MLWKNVISEMKNKKKKLHNMWRIKCELTMNEHVFYIFQLYEFDQSFILFLNGLVVIESSYGYLTIINQRTNWVTTSGYTKMRLKLLSCCIIILIKKFKKTVVVLTTCECDLLLNSEIPEYQRLR